MKRKNPKISVILPVYNAKKFLEETITSILNQSFEDFEFIIINDESKDKSLEIIKKYSKKDKRIILLNNKKNLGCVNTRNRGLKMARGEYIAVMDSDDVSLRDRFKIQADYLDKHPEIFLIGGSAIIIDEEGNRLGVFLKYDNPSKTVRKLEKTNCILHPSVMYRNTKEFFYREKFSISDDYDFILNVLSARKKITNLPEFLIKYRVNQNSATFIKKNPDYFFQKAKEFYQQRIKTGKDDYENLEPPEVKISVDSNKSNLKINIIAEFQDNQGKKLRKNIKSYFRNYGFDKQLVIYYLLSLFPIRIMNFLRKKI
ncbi:MAG: glycosyltransferase [Candidatus Diapherotrites archaeon]